MSHAWDTDSRGRKTHERVKALKASLADMGWNVWFDEERLLLGCNIDAEMASGISGSDAVCICITRKYVEKINSQRSGDNCVKEWNFAQSQNKKMLPLIMESDMLDVRKWPIGVMSMYLGNTFYIDCTGDDLSNTANRLGQMLELLGLKRRSSLRKTRTIRPPRRRWKVQTPNMSKPRTIVRL